MTGDAPLPLSERLSPCQMAQFKRQTCDHAPEGAVPPHRGWPLADLISSFSDIRLLILVTLPTKYEGPWFWSGASNIMDTGFLALCLPWAPCGEAAGTWDTARIHSTACPLLLSSPELCAQRVMPRSRFPNTCAASQGSRRPHNIWGRQKKGEEAPKAQSAAY